MGDFNDNNVIFDPSTVEDSPDLIEPGDYTAEIIEAENAAPRSGDGHMLKVTWAIVEGEYEGRRVWQTLCYDHSSQTTKDIAQKMLKRICVALDIGVLRDPEALKFKPANIKVGIERDKTGQYDDKNKIIKVWALNESDGETIEARAHAPKNGGGGAGAASASNKPAATSTSRASTTPTTVGPGVPPWKTA
jgi:hypothetical protein